MNTVPKLNPEVELPSPQGLQTRSDGQQKMYSEVSAVLSMIERASRDTTIDLEKMRELLRMRSQVVAEAAEGEFYDAMAAAQSEMLPVATDASNPQTRSRYASHFALDQALRPIYSKYGFVITFDTGEAPPELVRIVCRVAKGRHHRDYHVDMPADGKGAKGGDVMTKTHATGGAISYGIRYLLRMIFNIAIGGDEDGNAAGGSGTINDEQLEMIQNLLKETGADVARFCEYIGVAKIEDIPANNFSKAIVALEEKRSGKKVTRKKK